MKTYKLIMWTFDHPFSIEYLVVNWDTGERDYLYFRTKDGTEHWIKHNEIRSIMVTDEAE